MTRELAAIEKDIAETTDAIAKAQGTETEVYSRIVGYYRSLKNWNRGKKNEFSHRVTFDVPEDAEKTASDSASSGIQAGKKGAGSPERYELFARKTCPNCPPVKDYLSGVAVPGATIDVDTPEGQKKAQSLEVRSAPTVIFYNKKGLPCGEAHNVAELAAIFGKAA
jgi:ribonucleoside-triphosphate reductase